MRRDTDWLVDAASVIAHLFFAAEAIESVVATGPNAVFLGSFCYPDDKGLLIKGEGRPDLPPGTAVCVEYVGPDDQYRFYSQVSAVEAGGVYLALPRAIERSDRRLARRHGVGGHPGFGFRFYPDGLHPFAGVVAVHDVAVSGLGLLFPAGKAPVAGALVDGELLLPGETPIRVCLEARHARPLGAEIFVGTMITGIVATDRARLVRFLVSWARANG